jgi:RNA polymerase sigma factor (sigma-70 family)
VDESGPDEATFDRWLAWLRAGQAGDHLAMDRLITEVRVFLAQVVAKELGRQHFGAWDASDVVQDCLQKVSRLGTELHATSDGQFRAWLRTMARNALLDRLRLGQTQKQGGDRVRGPLPEDANGVVQIASDTSTPSQQAMRGEEEELVEAALGRLSPEDQQVIRLRRPPERLSWSEIARQMNRSEVATKQLFHRALQRLGKELGGRT